jgi:hypothetical protein
LQMFLIIIECPSMIDRKILKEILKITFGMWFNYDYCLRVYLEKYLIKNKLYISVPNVKKNYFEAIENNKYYVRRTFCVPLAGLKVRNM